VAAGGGDPSDSCCAALRRINGTDTATSTGGPGVGCGPVGSIVPAGGDFTASGAAAIDAHSLQPAVAAAEIGSVAASSAADIVLGCVHQWLKIGQAGPRRSQALLVSGPEREVLSYRAFGFMPE
jgi:hypothetical protein